MNVPLISDYKAVLSTPAGKSVIWHIIGLGQPFNGSFDPVSAEITAYRCGRQSVSLELIQCLEEVDPSIFPRLILTNLEKTNANTSNSDDTE
jgi:hypothetical protein